MDEGMILSDAITVQAPAKVNLLIRVLGRESNGYHALWSLMHTVGLFDQLHIRLNSSHNQIRLSCDDAALPTDRGNLVYRAAEAVLRRAGRSVGVEIDIQKAIPLAAGLGGGSSDAAAAFYGLVQLLKLNWEVSTFCEVGSELGSDIPFFFHAPCAIVRGWGQEVTACTVQGIRWLVLVNPGFPIQTKWAYGRLAEGRSEIPPLCSWTETVERQGSVHWDDLIGHMENDFESPLFSLYPVLRFMKDKLQALGAQAALLSGSGATVFGVFDTLHGASVAASTLRQETQWYVFDVSMENSSMFSHPRSFKTSSPVSSA